MMCYKDKTFCNNKDCHKWAICYDALTPEIIANAEKFGLLISQAKFNCEESPHE